MKLGHQTLFRFLGWNTQGDLGPWTFYTSKRQALVFYLRAPPTKPPTPLQTIRRNRWGQAAQAWTQLSAEARANWERATHAAHLRITGLNLWMYWKLTADESAIRTVERESGIPLLL